MTTISLRFDEADGELVRSFAKLKNISVSELIRQAVIERIEDEIDLAAFEKARAEYEKDPVTYSLDEVEHHLGLK
ncbi:MAG: CopG family transcriptional regulator [Pyramidobacter sp.]|nr:CopG family transcriptional regulator [Pyramidobacter sp.]MBQ9423761.1 CopG family transcriptional regulator [Pyramidobacter sp.]